MRHPSRNELRMFMVHHVTHARDFVEVTVMKLPMQPPAVMRRRHYAVVRTGYEIYRHLQFAVAFGKTRSRFWH